MKSRVTAPKTARYWGMTALSVLVLSISALGAPSSTLAQSSAPYTFAFKDADLADVTEAILGRALNLTYSIDPDLTAKVTFRIDRRLTPAQLLQAFESTLALQDIAVVKNGQTLLLEKRAKAKASTTVRTLDEGKHAIGYQTLAVPLTHAAAPAVAKALQAVGAGGVISYVDEAQNQLVLAGTAQEIDAAVQSIHLFDRGSSENTKLRFFPLERAAAPAVAEEITQILRAARIEGVNIVPMKRLNGLFAFARTTGALEEVSKWVAKLDVASEDKSNTVWIYRPKNASADNLKTALSSVIGLAIPEAAAAGDRKAGGDERPKSPPTSEAGAAIMLSGDGMRVGVDKESNALLISASPAQWLQIQKLLNELDRPPGEVLIEASIVEVTLSKGDRFGVDFSVLGSNKHIGATLSSDSGGAVGASFPGFAITYVDTNLKAAVQALGSNSRIEVISAPKIMALDNKTATLNVGDQVPVVSQSAQSTATANAPLVNTVDYRNTGVILKVTPRISGGDTIILDVSQEVSSVAATTTSGIDSPTILQRRLESSLILNDGGVVALGGMISSSRSRGDSGLPVLKDIPGLGALFRMSSNDLSRTELVVLLSAKIIHNRGDADKALNSLSSDMQELKAHGLLHP